MGRPAAASRQYLLDHPQAEWEAEIQPDRITDERGGVAIARIERISGRHIRGQISDHTGCNRTKPNGASADGTVLSRGIDGRGGHCTSDRKVECFDRIDYGDLDASSVPTPVPSSRGWRSLLV
jgi:hypothetical protein